MVQSGGLLNAFATRFSFRNLVVLYSDVMELAYEQGESAVDFIIAHELAHIADLKNHKDFDRLINLIEALNDRFWSKFEATDWGKSKFIVSYMIEDDYDGTAYNQLISHVKSDGVQVYGKGIHGRHNDATGPIAGWVKSQYDKILREDFSRGVEI